MIMLASCWTGCPPSLGLVTLHQSNTGICRNSTKWPRAAHSGLSGVAMLRIEDKLRERDALERDAFIYRESILFPPSFVKLGERCVEHPTVAVFQRLRFTRRGSGHSRTTARTSAPVNGKVPPRQVKTFM